MTPEISVYSEVARQVPAVGVGLFVFMAYQKLVGKLVDVMTASSAAITANTSALVALKESIDRGMARAEARHEQLMTTLDSVPGKVIHELRNPEHARVLQEAVERRRASAT